MEEIEQDEMIEIPKTETYLKASKDISNFLLTLNLPTKEYNELLKRLLEYTSIVRKDAFMLGLVPHIVADTKELQN